MAKETTKKSTKKQTKKVTNKVTKTNKNYYFDTSKLIFIGISIFILLVISFIIFEYIIG